jgi:Tfp pilus assembly protein PilF
MLSAFFWMLTLWAYVRYVRHPGWAGYVCVVFLFILGLMSKPMVVTLPFVLLLLDYWPLNRLRPDGSGKNLSLKIAGLFREKIPLFILSAASAGITILVQRQSGAMKSFDVIPLTDRLANVLISYINYIIKSVYPFKLSVFYPYPNVIPGWQLISSVVILSALTGTVIKLMHRKPWFIVGWLWFLGTLVPVIGLVQVGMQSMADRYMYLPMIGLFIPVAWGIPELLSKWRHRKAVLSVSAVCILLSFLWVTRFQLAYWADTYTLFNRAIAVTENNYLAYDIVGDELGLKGDYAAAEKYFLTALKIKPDDADAMEKLGQLAFKNKKYAQALDYYQKALAARPNDAKILSMIGESLFKFGKLDTAVNYYIKALVLKPSDPEIYNLVHAVEHYSETLRITPDDATTHYNIGVILFQQQQIRAADEHFYKAVQIDNSYEKAKIALAMTRRRLEKNN